MEERRLRHQQGEAAKIEPLDEDDPFAPSSGQPAAEGGAAAASESVRVIHGPMMLDVALAGMTVGEAAELLRGTLHLTGDVEVIVNGDEATSETRLEKSSTLEFVRRAGEKGAGQ